MEGAGRHPARIHPLPPEAFPSYFTREEGREQRSKNRVRLLPNWLHPSPSPCRLSLRAGFSPACAPGDPALELTHGDVPRQAGVPGRRAGTGAQVPARARRPEGKAPSASGLRWPLTSFRGAEAAAGGTDRRPSPLAAGWPLRCADAPCLGPCGPLTPTKPFPRDSW